MSDEELEAQLNRSKSRRHFFKVALAAAILMPGKAGEVEAQCGGSGSVHSACCLLEGTRISVEFGQAAIEELERGDLVKTYDGVLEKVRWVGRRTIKNFRKSILEDVAPIRIRTSAISEGIPSSDLLVSPNHCLFVDGVLIPAKLLVNRKSISYVVRGIRPDITYYHVELDRHNVILANGLGVETYGGGNRHRDKYDNCASYYDAYGLNSDSTAVLYAPVLSYDGGKQELTALIRLMVSSIGFDVRDKLQRRERAIAIRGRLMSGVNEPYPLS